jgi:hypothetical protein
VRRYGGVPVAVPATGNTGTPAARTAKRRDVRRGGAASLSLLAFIASMVVLATHSTLVVATPTGSDAPLQCPQLTGWLRIVELYAGHWDAVTLVSLSGSSASAPLVRRLQLALLCAAPLSLSEFGTAAPLVSCDDAWFSASRGCDTSAGARDAPYGPDNTPAWRRFEHGVPRRSRLFHSPVVPDVGAGVTAMHKQHDSAELRPADVAVYMAADVEGASGSDSDALRRFSEHVTAQADETLHAVIVYGDVCAEQSAVR